MDAAKGVRQEDRRFFTVQKLPGEGDSREGKNTAVAYIVAYYRGRGKQWGRLCKLSVCEESVECRQAYTLPPDDRVPQPAIWTNPESIYPWKPEPADRFPGE